MKLLFVALAAAIDSVPFPAYQVDDRTYFEHVQRPSGKPIPDDCEVYQSGCTSCGVNNGQTTFCSMVMCQYSQCLPYCSNFSAESKKIPENCKLWHDGCNRCFPSKIETTFVSEATGLEFTSVTYSSENMGCTKMFCEKPEEPRCLEYVNCMVDYEAMGAIE